jgi:hypothetical protein
MNPAEFGPQFSLPIRIILLKVTEALTVPRFVPWRVTACRSIRFLGTHLGSCAVLATTINAARKYAVGRALGTAALGFRFNVRPLVQRFDCARLIYIARAFYSLQAVRTRTHSSAGEFLDAAYE